jgi:hypothetical protein
MAQKILRCSRGGEGEVIQQDQYRFVLENLLTIGMPKELLAMMPDDSAAVTVLDRIEFRKVLKKYSVRVTELADGVDVFVGDERIAQWRLISVEMKENLDHANGDRLYMECLVDTLTLEEENDRKRNNPH